MQTLHQALLLQKLYLLKSIGFDYYDLQFQKPLQTQFPSQNQKNLNQAIKECQLCPQKLSQPHIGLCNPHSKLLFLTITPLLDLQTRFVSKGALMLKKIIENVFALPLQQVSILSLLKCEIPKNTQEECTKNCMGYFLKQLEFSQSKTIVILGEEVYNALTQDKTPYKNIQGKLFKWNHLKLFPTFSLAQLLRQPELKIQAHKEFLTLKKDLYETNQ
ncbi:uracil-DNA glycosylase family protein [Helicobacter canadensis]|uniref:Uracil-DNA glycosylase n=1 Tax=Helicobacter canadensis MIT 98-5491 TaxID=537970 RepID=C5ZXH9_9HELI|nr:uracil-DNA glycosylase family protein [Helicobacter canadensis]EES89847.1 uracil-DNA glycosylase [Helicobacter canadensis MIT 98-5491]EFR48647.1 uracil-DNA glycosylase, family 4 [Helicobacter canadensis MIT 98-5491]STO99889.1 family 4 uracil-DNA glycosylase [Helicobacter canadensis]